MRTVAISGVTGFVGKHLVPVFVKGGWKVVGLCRRPSEQPPVAESVSFRYFDLSDERRELDLHGVDILIHCAIEPYRYHGTQAKSVNVEGSRRLFSTARACGVKKIVFISSLAARDGTSSPYGDDKLTIESLLNLNRDLVIRLGLVIGDGGIFRALYSSIRNFRAAPIFRGGLQPVHTIGVQDLGPALRGVVERNGAGIFVFASREPVTTRLLYQEIARKAGVRVHLIPLPYHTILWLLETVERLGLALPISSSNLKGVGNMRRVDFQAYQYPDGAIQPFDSVMKALQMSNSSPRS